MVDKYIDKKECNLLDLKHLKGHLQGGLTEAKELDGGS